MAVCGTIPRRGRLTDGKGRDEDGGLKNRKMGEGKIGELEPFEFDTSARQLGQGILSIGQYK